MKIDVVSSQFAFTKAVQSALKLKRVGVHASTTDALHQVRSPRTKPRIVVIDLTSVTEADRLIHFLTWSDSTRHVLIIAVGHDLDFSTLAPDALRLLDGALRAPFTPVQLSAAIAAADAVRIADQ